MESLPLARDDGTFIGSVRMRLSGVAPLWRFLKRRAAYFAPPGISTLIADSDHFTEERYCLLQCFHFKNGQSTIAPLEDPREYGTIYSQYDEKTAAPTMMMKIKTVPIWRRKKAAMMMKTKTVSTTIWRPKTAAPTMMMKTKTVSTTIWRPKTAAPTMMMKTKTVPTTIWRPKTAAQPTTMMKTKTVPTLQATKTVLKPENQ
jgi:hypothetical protein